MHNAPHTALQTTVNPNPRGGGGKSAIRLRNNIITVGTEWKMELRIGCKFKFVYWCEPKKKKLDQTDHLGTLADHFCRQDPKFFEFFFEIRNFQFLKK